MAACRELRDSRITGWWWWLDSSAAGNLESEASWTYRRLYEWCLGIELLLRSNNSLNNLVEPPEEKFFWFSQI